MTTKLIEAEIELASRGQLDSELASLDELAPLQERILRKNFKKAEALSLSDPRLHENLNPLEKIRIQLVRGHCEEARELIDQESKSSSVDPELLLEKARLESYSGRWNESLEFCNELLNASPVGLTRMTALQVRANVFCELGYYAQASSDLEKIDSLSLLFPFAQAVFYGRLLKAKLGILCNKEAPEVSQLLAALHSKDKKLDLDSTLSLCRLKFVQEVCGEGLHSIIYSHCARDLARALGDPLYQELAELEIFLASRRQKTNVVQELQKFSESSRFARIQNLVQELRDLISGPSGATVPPSTTAKLLFKLWNSQNDLAPAPEQIEAIVVLNRQVTIRVSGGALQTFTGPQQLFKAAALLAPGPMHKDEFYCQLWNEKSYFMEQHDPKIRLVLCKLRKKLGLNVISEEKKIRPHHWVAITL
jgi:hypothetical protein